MPSRQNPPPRPIEINLPDFDWSRHRGAILGLPLLLLILFGAYSSFFTVQPEEEGVVKRFGAVINTRQPGLHFKLPFGIDRVQIVPSARVLKEEFGFRTISIGDRTSYQKDRSQREESLMLTGDLKVIDVEWVVQYRISNPDRFLHGARDPQQTLRDISEGVMRRIVGNSLGSDVLTEKRVKVALDARDELQTVLDRFDIGIQVSTVELQDVTPPEPVKPAFNEVNQAEQERERLINEAEKRRNQVIPRAEGQAKQIVAEAEAYRLQRVNRARGEAERFTSMLEAYRESPAVTRERLYLEMIDEVLPGVAHVYVLDENSGSAPLPLLHLGQPPAND